jgi:L-ascorbate oxidase
VVPESEMGCTALVSLLSALLGLSVVIAEDPYLYFTWKVTYGTIAPLGVKQRGILINGQFPGPNINSTTNNNIIINVYNYLDEPFLLSWFVNFHQLLKYFVLRSM